MESQPPKKLDPREQPTVPPEPKKGKSLQQTADFSMKSTGGAGESRSETPPENFGKYRILKTLGEGGMGAVYLAEDPDLERQVALKVPFVSKEQQSAILDRFKREAKAVAALQHPNICPIHEVGQVDGRPYMAMGYIKGKPLEAYIDPAKPLPIKSIVPMVAKIGYALAYAHQQGIVHRDLKPANIMINERREPVIMDFGLAQRTNERDKTRLTKAGTMMGTPAYMPPEQVAGDIEKMGPGCDIYSLGVILYEMLTGVVPFDGDLITIVSQIALTAPKPPSQLRPAIDARLADICLKAMAKKPEERFASMNEFAFALAEFARTGITATSVEAQAPVIRQPDGNPPTASPQTATSLMTESTESMMSGVNRKRNKLALGLIIAVFVISTVAVTVLTPRPMPPKESLLAAAPASENNAKESLRAAPTASAEIASAPAAANALSAPAARSAANPAQLADSATDSSAAAPLIPDPPLSPDVPLVKVLGNPLPFMTWGYAHSVDFSPDGAWLAAGCEDNTLHLWNARTGAKQYGLLDSSSLIARFAPDNRHLYTAGHSHPPEKRAISTGKALFRTQYPTDLRFNWIDVSADGAYLAAGGESSAAIWNANVAKPLRQLQVPKWNAGVFSPDSKHLAIDGIDGGVVLHDIAVGKSLWQSADFRDEPRFLAYHPNGRTIACTTSGAVVTLLDAATGKVQSRFSVDLSGRLDRLDYSPDGKFLAATYSLHPAVGWGAFILDAETGKTLHQWKLPYGHPYALRFSRDSQFLAVGVATGGVRVWDVAAQREIFNHPAQTPSCQAVEWVNGDQQIMTLHSDGSLCGWDADSGKETFHVWRGVASRNSLIPGPNPDEMIVVQDSQRVAVVSTKNGDKKYVLPPESQSAAVASLSADGTLLATGHLNGGVSIFDMKAKQVVTSFRLPSSTTATIRGLAWNQTGKRLAIASDPNKWSIYIWDRDRKEIVQQRVPLAKRGGFGVSLAYSPDGKFLLVADGDLIRVLDALSLEDRGELPGHNHLNIKIVFAPQTGQLTTCAHDGQIRFWDLSKLQSTRSYRLAGRYSSVNAVAFSSDGKRMVSGNGNGTMYILKTPSATSN